MFRALLVDFSCPTFGNAAKWPHVTRESVDCDGTVEFWRSPFLYDLGFKKDMLLKATVTVVVLFPVLPMRAGLGRKSGGLLEECHTRGEGTAH